jgi:hypothetical protein
MEDLIIQKILEVNLIKVEKSFRNDIPMKYYYDFILEDIDEPLMIIFDYKLEDDLVGSKVNYKINEDLEITHFGIM